MCTGSQLYLAGIVAEGAMGEYLVSGNKEESNLRVDSLQILSQASSSALSHTQRDTYWMHTIKQCTPLLLDHLFGSVWLEEVCSRIWS